MHFPEILKLVLYFQVCHEVSSSRYEVFENQISALSDNTENILEKYFIHFNKAYLMKKIPRHITIIGASFVELIQAKPLLQNNWPYSICKDVEKCVSPEIHTTGSIFVIFLNDFDEKTIEKHHKISSVCRNTCEFFFIRKGIEIKIDAITSFLKRLYDQGATFSHLSHLDENGVKVYRLYITEKCTLSSKLILNWTPGMSTTKMKFAEPMIKNFNGCPIPVGSFEYQPKMILEEKENGSLAISGGLDGMLVLLIAERLNFSLKLKSPSISNEKYNYSQKVALVRDVASGLVEFGVSRSNPTNAQEISRAYDEECLTWAVPRVSSKRTNLVWTEFSWKVWILVALVFVCSCIFGYVNHVVILSRNGPGNRGGIGFIMIMIDILSINLGNPVVRMPVSMGGKFMLMASLYYAVVTTTAYKSSLSSILTTMKSVPMATNAQEILEAGLKVGGSAYHYNILKKQENDSVITAEIIKRYEICANDFDALHRVGNVRDFALLARRSTLIYAKDMTVRGGKLIQFDILEGCALAYPTTMIFREGSYLLRPINDIIIQARESGIIKYWDRINHTDDRMLERKNFERFSALLLRKKYQNIFIFYVGCIHVCILVFFIEILVGRFGYKKRQIIVRCGRFMRR